MSALQLRLPFPILAAALVLAAAPAARALEPPSDPFFLSRGSWGQDWSDQWAIQDVGFTAGPDSAWRAVEPGAAPVVVALVDTGLDWNHRDISWNNIWRNPGEVPDNGKDDDGDGYVDDVIGWNFFANDGLPWDHDGHGTFVAGMLAATWNDVGVAGINPKVRLMILKALNNFGHTRASFLAKAIVYAADHGARVINLSVGGEGTTDIERDAIDYAWSKGAIVVVAAGNESADVTGYGLAAHPKVLLVGATDFEGHRAVFSNWGRNVDLAAPGLDVLSLRARRTDLMRGIPGLDYEPGSAYVGGDKRYYRSSGTSFSAPIVAGVASLVLANRPKLTNEQVVRILRQSARDVEVPGVDQYTGYGVVDARAALEADPDFFVDAAIDDLQAVQRDQGVVVQVRGTADADRFAGARLSIGEGKEPDAWKPVGQPLARAVRDGVLGEIPAGAFAGAATWQVRVVTEHRSGRTREARFELQLE